MLFKKDNKINRSFSKMFIGLASPDAILEKSYGEVQKPETINYRTYKPEKDGLFCEKIFGPSKDFECACGKYKRIRYKGIVCDRCGVEVTEKKVRRERMGHIKLVVPIVHVWYFRSLPNKIAYLLSMNTKTLEGIIYYDKWVVIQPGVMKGSKNVGDVLTQEEYDTILDHLPKDNQNLQHKDPNRFIAKMGADAVKDLLKKLSELTTDEEDHPERTNLDELSILLRTEARESKSKQKQVEALKRLSVVEAFRTNKDNKHLPNLPEWMVLDYIPVIPPDLRPLVPLDGGRFASADLNDLYRRVIIRNNRLKRLIEIKAPDVILRNEKRMLQESVDALFDNSRKSSAVKADGGRSFKSLSDSLKGKQGRFRQNLLGKRVDYSGRSVIVVGPELKMHECGLPKDMAAELFKPFIIRKLIDRGIVSTVKMAKKIVEQKDVVIWDILENILKGHPVLLNRAPTLHRLSIQAFQPKLIEGKAIQLHPLVTAAFNADFDGDQMAVHVPLSNAAILEAQLLMLSSHNILNPQNGNSIALPSQDMVLGLYYITKPRKSSETVKILGEGRIFANMEEVLIGYDEKQIDLHAMIKVRVNIREEDVMKYKIVDTTVGRVLFNQYVPKEVGFVNQLLTKKGLVDIVGKIIQETNITTTVKFLDDIKQLGFYMAFKGGLSFSINDLKVPEERQFFIEQASAEVQGVTDNHNMGFITNNERLNQILDIWGKTDMKITSALMKVMEEDQQGFNSIYMMLDSGARGSKTQVKQLVGIRGLMARPYGKAVGRSGTREHVDRGDIIENPILSNFKMGLEALDYFISTHGARKGLADTALKTADAGYLTRRLVDVVQDVVITEDNCLTLRGIPIAALKDNDAIIEKLSERIEGRIALEDVYDPSTNELLVKEGDEITKKIAQKIDKVGIEEIKIRSVLTCEARRGVCMKCYGRNLANNRMVQKGDAVGIVAAQSIGEPGTQLTLRTFHVGGVAFGEGNVQKDLKAGFEGVLYFEGISVVEYINEDKKTQKIVISRTAKAFLKNKNQDRIIATYIIPYGSIIENDISINKVTEVKKDTLICSWDPFNNVRVSEYDGVVKFKDVIEEGSNANINNEDDEKIVIEPKGKRGSVTPTITIEYKEGEEVKEKDYVLSAGSHIMVKNNQKIKAGHIIAKKPRVLKKVRDITGGLPRVTELFEARNPAVPAIVSEIDGLVKFGQIRRGNREIVVTSIEPIVVEKKYLVPQSREIIVEDGDFVRAGDPLSDGEIALVDILSTKGIYEVQRYVVEHIQEVYRLQGVKINDKHLEVIVRQMMRKVEIIDAGDTNFLQDEQEDKFDVIDENNRVSQLMYITDAGKTQRYQVGDLIDEKNLRDENEILEKEGKAPIIFEPAKPATTKPVLLGITRASLGVQSWISAASFQETTKILSQAAIQGKIDEMVGLKENIITGLLIPAGTGQREYANLLVGNKEEQNRLSLTKEISTFDDEE